MEENIIDEEKNFYEKKYKKLKKKLKKKKKEIAVLEEKYDSVQIMMSMTRNYMAEAKKKLEAQGKELQRSNKNFTDSIQYASRIQRALFSANTFDRHGFKDSFVFLKPKDIVSGDAPWFFKDGDFGMVAAIDCTGHGVPGAMLTVLALSLINQMMTTQRHKSPRNLVLELDQLIHSYLRSGSKNQSRDGLDLAIISYNAKERELTFVGAHRPLWLWQNGELTKIKGSRFTVGDANLEGLEKLQEKTFKMQSGDRAYIFSDGFPDQFGGPNNFKLMTGNFYKLMTDTAVLKNIDDQKAAISSFFSNWKGDEEQTDDVLVIGIEF